MREYLAESPFRDPGSTEMMVRACATLHELVLIFQISFDVIERRSLSLSHSSFHNLVTTSLYNIKTINISYF
jgi:hypothetical protein